ncbi:MAG: hypothetical protein R2874_13820 [Desulfobacterales bacterium]
MLRLYQITFSKGNTTTYPMDREFLYTDQAEKGMPDKDRAAMAYDPKSLKN